MDERLKFVARLLEGEDGGALPRVRYLSQDRLQNLLPLQGLWPAVEVGVLKTAKLARMETRWHSIIKNMLHA